MLVTVVLVFKYYVSGQFENTPKPLFYVHIYV